MLGRAKHYIDRLRIRVQPSLLRRLKPLLHSLNPLQLLLPEGSCPSGSLGILPKAIPGPRPLPQGYNPAARMELPPKDTTRTLQGEHHYGAE